VLRRGLEGGFGKEHQRASHFLSRCDQSDQHAAKMLIYASDLGLSYEQSLKGFLTRFRAVELQPVKGVMNHVVVFRHHRLESLPEVSSLLFGEADSETKAELILVGERRTGFGLVDLATPLQDDHDDNDRKTESCQIVRIASPRILLPTAVASR